MNVEKVRQRLLEKYPNVHIKENPNAEGEITEIVGEIDRQLVGSDRDVAVVVADSSMEHVHNVITEEYEVIRGSLRVFRNGELNTLREGDKITIAPGTRHRVEGNETWFYCYSVPDWFPGDYFTV